MPAPLTYPGVYVEEIPSGVRTITGVATSVTAFVGRTRWGTVGEPIEVNSFGEFERAFGGLWLASPTTFAVRDFFLNGGSRALIVRLFKTLDSRSGVAQLTVYATGGAGSSSSSSSSSSGVGAALQLVAASPGEWGNHLHAELKLTPVDEDTAGRLKAAENEFFELTVTYRDGKADREQIETFKTLTFATDSPRRFDKVLARESRFARAAVDGGKPLTASMPVAGEGDASGGEDSAALDVDAYVGASVSGGDQKTGIHALLKADIFNLLCVPPDTRGGSLPDAVYPEAMKFCEERRAMFLADPPDSWSGTDAVKNAERDLVKLGLTGREARNAAVFFPRIKVANPLLDGQEEEVVPSGAVAGVFARTDATRGVWKAPAGIDGALTGVRGLTVTITDEENGRLNQLGLNCLRTFAVFGNVVWGARTARGADQAADEYKYIPVRRTALFIEETLFRALKWVVFEPNDEPLWSQIRLNVGAFMQDLFRQGAFQGKSPQEAYFVKCDGESTTQLDIDRGIVNIHVGFAPLKPAEFVVIKLQQLAGQSQA